MSIKYQPFVRSANIWTRSLDNSRSFFRVQDRYDPSYRHHGQQTKLTAVLFFLRNDVNLQVPLKVTLSAGSSDPSGIVSLKWDCDGDGVFEAESKWTPAAGRAHICTFGESGVFDASVQAISAEVYDGRIFVFRCLSVIFPYELRFQ